MQANIQNESVLAAQLNICMNIAYSFFELKAVSFSFR